MRIIKEDDKLWELAGVPFMLRAHIRTMRLGKRLQACLDRTRTRTVGRSCHGIIDTRDGCNKKNCGGEQPRNGEPWASYSAVLPQCFKFDDVCDRKDLSY